MAESIFVLFLLSGLIKSFILFLFGDIFIPDITLLFSLLLLGIYIIDAFKSAWFKNEIHIPRPSRTILFTLSVFYLWMIASLLYTQSPRYCYTKVVLFTTNLVAFGFPLLYRKFDPRRFFRSFAYSGSALVLIYSILIPNIYDMYMRTQTNREFVVKYLDVGYLAGIVVLAAAFACPEMKRLPKIVLIGFNAWAIAISSARGPLVFLLFTLIIRLTVSAYHFARKPRTLRFKNLFYLGAGLGILAAAAYYVMDKYSALLERSLTRLFQLTDPVSGSVSERVSMISFSFDKIFESARNFLFGLGVGSFGFVFNGLDTRQYPHNVILEIGFELGIIGVLLFFLLLFLCFKKIRLDLNLLLIFIYLLLNSLKSYSLVDLRIMFGFISVLVLI